MLHVLSSTLGSLSSSAQDQNQTSAVSSNQEIPGCWDRIKDIALNFFKAIADSTPENKLGIFGVVLLYGFCMAVFIFQIIFALKR